MSGGRRRLSDKDLREIVREVSGDFAIVDVAADLLRCRKALRMLIRVYEQTGYQAGYVPYDIARAALNDAGGRRK